MNGSQEIYQHRKRRFYSLLMMVLLLWLTVSIPVVYEAQAQAAAAKGMCEDAAANPFSNTTEEKVENGVNTISEYLHETHHPLPSVSPVAAMYKCHPDDLYFAFHPELLSPPPEQTA